MARGFPYRATIENLWGGIAPQLPAYDLVRPGAHSFICRAETCNAWCCRALTVPLGDRDVARLSGTTGLVPPRFLECADGEPIALPLAQPYVLARAGGACALLGANLACTAYDGRPDACREYPYQVLFVDSGTVRLMRPAEEILATIAAPMAGTGLSGEGTPDDHVIPLLVRHRECPGFTGAPLAATEWIEILRSTAALQYGRTTPGPARDRGTSGTVAGMGKPDQP